ncbi:hypothetical protein [Nocardia sp. NPDC051570]|uniref:hypothetical protein n=1 Tax=Nocardia sp. NPDC051570 TaxID=3364324 RepID=UPI0037914323
MVVGRGVEIREDRGLFIGYLQRHGLRFFHVEIVQIETLVERFVEASADFRVGVSIEGIGIGDEVECVAEHAGADGQFLGGVDLRRFESFAFVLQRDELHPDFGLRY